MTANLPNLLTAARMAAIVPIAGLLLWPSADARLAALAVFAAAGLSDLLDGWLARRLNAESALGRMLDPVADKILTVGVIVLLVATGDAPALPAAIIVVREILVSGLREQLASRAANLPVTQLAKWKTGLVMAALALLLAAGALPAGERPADALADTGVVCLWLAALLAGVTGLGYLRTGIRRLRDTPP